jgi:uncharacterized protein YbjT (DUF2867 family)
MNNVKLILVTGATGYVGSRLIPYLLKEGYQVRAFVRNLQGLESYTWSKRIEIAVGDVFSPETLESALSDIDAAYYFIHSMTSGADFAGQDVVAASNFAEAARKAGVKRIVYLGGLGNPRAQLSEHLRSRHETGEELRKSGVNLTEFRAAIIVGSGSISFEMIRYLAERVPAMICPRWVRTKVQPVAIEDVISYLVASLKNPESAGQIIEIGGADVLTYGEMMKGYARVIGLHRWLFHVPVLTPRLSSYWVHWVTPVSAAYARPLIEGLRNEVVVMDNKASRLFPDIKPVGYEHAVRQAISQLDPEYFEVKFDPTQDTGRLVRFSKIRNGMIIEVRQKVVCSDVETVYAAFTELGGANRWPCNLAWRLRAAIDRIIGGVGMRKGRPQPGNIKLDDTVDFLRVVKIEPNKMIRFKVEMKLPGNGWLQFEAKPVEDSRTGIVQTMFFAPRGLFGTVYWYLLLPVHRHIFNKIINKLAEKAEQAEIGGENFNQAI